MLLSRLFVLSRPWASWVTLATQESMPPAPSLRLPVQVCLSSRNALTTPLDQFTATCVGPPWPGQVDTRSHASQDGGGVSAALQSGVGVSASVCSRHPEVAVTLTPTHLLAIQGFLWLQRRPWILHACAKYVTSRFKESGEWRGGRFPGVSIISIVGGSDQ